MRKTHDILPSGVPETIQPAVTALYFSAQIYRFRSMATLECANQKTWNYRQSWLQIGHEPIKLRLGFSTFASCNH
jgi:hypothetical protein